MDESKSVLVQEDEAPSSGKISTIFRLITVEPIMALCAVSMSIQSTVQGQYLYFAVGQLYNLTSVNQSKAFQCSKDDYNSTKANASEKELVDQLQDLTSMWSMYISLANGIASLIVVPFLSPMTDRLGRKWALKLVVFGDLVNLSIKTVAIFLSWPLYVFVVTSTLSGLTGGNALALATAFSYLADVTTSKERPFRIALAEVCYGLLSMVTNVAIGAWLTYVAYQWPFVLAIGASTLNLIYIFLLPEVRGRHMEVANSFQIKRIIRAYTARGHNTASMTFAILGLLIFSVQGYNSSVEEQYSMGFPFCWSSVLIGVFFGIQSFSMNVGLLFTAGVFTKYFDLHSLTLAMIGIASSSASKLIVAFAKNSIELFSSTILGIFCQLPIPMIRTYLSVAVDQDEQGAIFASISVVQIFSSLFSSTATNTIYRETVAWFPGFVFLVLSGMAAMSFIMIATSYFLYQKEERKKRNEVFTEINADDPNVC